MDDKVIRFVGFDTAEELHECVLLSVDGSEEVHLKCKNRVEAIEQVFAKLIMRLSPNERLAVVLEAPRAHGRVVFEVASRFGFDVLQVGTVALNHFRQCEGQPRKDDHWDAYLAARMAFLRALGCHVVSDPRPEERLLSRLTRARSRARDEVVRLGNQLRAIMLELAPIVLDREWEGPELSSVAMRKILRRWPAFSGLERAKRGTIRAIFRSCRYREARAQVAVEAVRDLPREVVVSPQERAVMATEIELILRQVDLLERSIAELEGEIRKIVKAHPICQKLMEMPGIGLITAAVLVGELLPLARNETEACSATYSGLTPLSRKSGKYLNGSRLGRGSNKKVLKVFFMSSVKSLQVSSLDHAYYEKKRADYKGHPKPHTAAILALARQRHKVIYKLMTTVERYKPEKLISSHLDREKRTHVA